jgi:hypothetical protein
MEVCYIITANGNTTRYRIGPQLDWKEQQNIINMLMQDITTWELAWTGDWRIGDSW